MMPLRRQHEGGDICAIFVHAGAGYHSVANEKLHLGAVNDAARVGMAILKNGGKATDAVEMAIRLLEDREITNAGYGSNLTIEGHVECDATIIDHLGRSGGVGAVSHVKNPIALARVVLDATSKPLSLQRVPPNLLVGPGATEFAAEAGFPVLSHDYLISESAQCRWFAWKQDLLEASQQRQDEVADSPETRKLLNAEQSVARLGSVNFANSLHASLPIKASGAQSVAPMSPPMSTDPSRTVPLSSSSLTGVHEPDPATISRHAIEPAHYRRYAKITQWVGEDPEPRTNPDDQSSNTFVGSKRQRLDGSFDTAKSTGIEGSANEQILRGSPRSYPQMEDHITDTVGCIAVDCFGHIAAGSSSGGIGMKHKGRCGPAALVGIGTAVIPVDSEDPEKACVATVTSGTGEHMATTSAAATAADRIYLRIRREGSKLKSCNEDEALHSMIKNDFMKHPGVKNQPCVGAIGVLAVKKTKDGIYFYFGHNTDSFAIASMHSEERKPVCTMSRSKGGGTIAQGGRVARSQRAKQ